MEAVQIHPIQELYPPLQLVRLFFLCRVRGLTPQQTHPLAEMFRLPQVFLPPYKVIHIDISP